MALFNRLATLITARANHQMDRLEDPAVMVGQLAHEIEDEIRNQNARLVQITSSMKRVKASVAANQKEAHDRQASARTELAHSHEAAARQHLAQSIAATKRAECSQPKLDELRTLESSIRADLSMLKSELRETLSQTEMLHATRGLGGAVSAGFTAMEDRRLRLQRYQAHAGGTDLQAQLDLKAAEQRDSAAEDEVTQALKQMQADMNKGEAA